ncbi:MAG: hypothetical protein ABJO30_05015 [Hyphomicrobiales bacterium]
MHEQAIKKPLLITCLILSAGLSGCAAFWPEAGNGGFAEHRFGISESLAHDRFDGRFNATTSKPHLSNLVQANGYSKRGRVAEAQYVHDVAILAFDKRIANLKARGAKRCAPGDLAKSEQLLVRVKRQWVGKLYGDALIDIERLEHRLDVVDRRIFHNQCQPGGHVIAHRSINAKAATKPITANSNTMQLSMQPTRQSIPTNLQTLKGTR